MGSLGVDVLEVSPRRIEDVATSLRHLPDVRYVERDLQVQSFETTPNDYWWPSEWSPVKTKAPRAWDTTTGSASTVIAILDTGVDAAQPDLQGALVPGRDVVNGDDDPSDDNGHGTQVAGIAAGRTNNGIGIASYCWTCSIMPVKVLGARGTGSTSDLAAGITWAADHGADVINMSLGSQSSSSTVAAAVRYAHDRGVVLVAAAGNYGTTAEVYPAAYTEVIGVAASDATDQLYSWSGRGPWVAVSAPGFNFTTGLNAWYGEFAGTSSAAPVVAGVAGLVRAAMPQATVVDVERAIEAGAAPIGNVVAFGRVDAAAAVAAAIGSPPTSPSPSPSPTVSPTVSSSATTSPSPSDSISPTPPATSPTDPPATTTNVFSGSLTKTHPSRTFTVTNGSGALEAVLTFSRVPTLSLDVSSTSGSTAAHAAGPAPVTIVVTLPAGASDVVVSGARQGSFSLSVTYVRP